MLLFSGDPDDPLAGYDELLRSTAVDAFVVTDTYLGNPQAAWLRSAAGAVRRVRPALGQRRDAQHPWVDVDGAAGAELATDHLLEQRPRPDRLDRLAQGLPVIGEDRRAGWTRAPCATRGPLHDRAGVPRRGHRPSSGREACGVLLDEAQPTGFVCASDTLAMGVLHTLAERGLRPGRDVAVVGFDDSQVAQVVPPGLTSVRQPLEQVAVEVVARSRACSPTPGPGDGVLPPPARRARLELRLRTPSASRDLVCSPDVAVSRTGEPTPSEPLRTTG